MQSIATLFEGQPRRCRDGLLYWFRAATLVAMAAAVSTPAMAEAPAHPAAGEETQAASEPETAAPPDGAAHSEDKSAPWNRRRTAPTGVDGQLRRLAADLKLDAAQQAKIRPILVARNEQMQRLQHDTRLTSTQRRQRVLAIGDSSAEQIRAQLTDAQRAQYIQPRAATAPKKGAAR